MSATPTNRPAQDKYAWGSGDIKIERAGDNTWSTTYVAPTGATVLCANTDDFMLHVMQESATRNVNAQDYFDEFMAGPQGKVMPNEIRTGLKRLGLI